MLSMRGSRAHGTEGGKSNALKLTTSKPASGRREQARTEGLAPGVPPGPGNTCALPPSPPRVAPYLILSTSIERLKPEDWAFVVTAAPGITVGATTSTTHVSRCCRIDDLLRASAAATGLSSGPGQVAGHPPAADNLGQVQGWW